MSTVAEEKSNETVGRQLAKFLTDLAVRADKAIVDENKVEDGKYLPACAVAEVTAYLTDNKIPGALLHSLRECPYRYSLQPYVFLWLLHRYMNTHWKK